jgi:glycerol-3-phosphate dehydrogenase
VTQARAINSSRLARPSLWRTPLRLALGMPSTPIAFDRTAALGRLRRDDFDVLVIGGGITGSGVALDAAARGLRVALVEQSDLASGTSGHSSRLIHGGLRYLQKGELGLVVESLAERQRLLANAPHLVRPQAFVIPLLGIKGKLDTALTHAHQSLLRSYDLAGGRRIGQRHRMADAAEVKAHLGFLRTERLMAGLVYWDARTDDARLTLAVARTAAEHGAVVATYATVTELSSDGRGRVNGALVHADGSPEAIEVRAKVVVNATGVWADQVEALTPDDELIVGSGELDPIAPEVAPRPGLVGDIGLGGMARKAGLAAMTGAAKAATATGLAAKAGLAARPNRPGRGGRSRLAALADRAGLGQWLVPRRPTGSIASNRNPRAWGSGTPRAGGSGAGAGGSGTPRAGGSGAGAGGSGAPRAGGSGGAGRASAGTGDRAARRVRNEPEGPGTATAEPARRPRLRPAKGIHITLPASLLPCDMAAVLPGPGDKRSIFVIPWGDQVYVGTTDTDYRGSLDEPRATQDDVDYLLRALNASTAEPLSASDVTGVWAGLRPLLADNDNALTAKTADLSRHHRVSVSASGLVTVTGGKLTTYRRMAADTVDVVVRRASSGGLSRRLRRSPTASMRLWGTAGLAEVRQAGAAARLRTDPATLEHLVSRFGGEARTVLAMVDAQPELSRPMVEGLPYLGAEAVYAARHEMAHTLMDILARRTNALQRDRLATVQAAPDVAALVAPELGWDEAETRRQVAQVLASAARDAEAAGLARPARLQGR